MIQIMNKPPSLRQWPHKSFRVLLILGFAYFYLLGLVAFTPQAFAASLDRPGGTVSDITVRRVDIAQPAVVRIITKIDGSLTVRFTSTSPAATFPLGGGTYPLEFSGTGSFISSHGELLTADHVVNPPHDQSLNIALYETAAPDIANYVNTHYQVQQPFTSDAIVQSLETGDFPSTPTYGQASSKVYLSTAYTGVIQAAKFDDLPGNLVANVDRIEAQSSFDAMDVAIVHVSGMDNMPTIQLSDSNQVAVLDDLTVIGFPGLADVSTSPTNLLTSSINKVYVSAIKTTDTGVPLLQVGGNIEHGDSGGPVLDNNGNIVGVVSFGINDSDETGETTFLQVANSAESLIKSQNINTSPGPLQRAWEQAINDYSSSQVGHWHKATQELSTISNTYRNFQGIIPYLNNARKQAANEQLPVSSSSLSNSIPWLAIVLAILFILVIVFLVIFLVLRQRTQPLAPAGTRNIHSSPAQYGGYPSWQNNQPEPGYSAPSPVGYGSTPWFEQSTGHFSAYQPMNTPPQTPPLAIPQTPMTVESSQVEGDQSLQNGFADLEPLSHGQVSDKPSTNSIYQPSPWLSGVPADDVAINPSQENIFSHPEPTQSSDELTLRPASSPDYDHQLPVWMPDRATVNNVSQENTFSHSEPTQTRGELRSQDILRQMAGIQDSEPVLPPARSFSVPRRPSTSAEIGPELAALSTDTYKGLRVLMAPCGHINTPDVRFCRLCGQPVKENYKDETTGML